MAFRETRDTVEHDQSAETEMEGEIREFVRRDVVTNLELETLRDMLRSEAARVQREIVQYSTLTQGALQSTKTIAESLTQLKKVPSLTLSD